MELSTVQNAARSANRTEPGRVTVSPKRGSGFVTSAAAKWTENGCIHL